MSIASLSANGCRDFWALSLHLARHATEADCRTLRAVAYTSDAAQAWPIALQVLCEFRRQQFAPDPRVWNLVMRSCPECAQELFDELRKHGDLSPESWSAALRAATKVVAWQSSCSMLLGMESARICPSQPALDGLLHQGWRQVAGLLAHLRGLEPSVATAARLRPQKDAAALLQEAASSGLQLDAVAVAAATSTDSGSQGPQWQAACALLEGACRGQLRLDLALLRTSISAVATGWLWQRALGRFRADDDIALEATLRPCQAAGAWAQALALLPPKSQRLGAATVVLESMECWSQWSNLAVPGDGDLGG
eukprot:s217_g17.t1